MKQILLLATCLFVFSASMAQKTTGAGKAKKAKNKNAISGFIRDAHHHPMADIQAFIYKPDSSIAASGYTDATGFYETNAVMPGKYDLRIVYPSDKYAVVTGVIIKKGMATVNLSMDAPSGDTAIAYTDLLPKPVEKKKTAAAKKK